MSLYLFEAIRPHHPHILVKRPFHELLVGYGTLHTFASKRELWRWSWRLRRQTWDAGIVLPPSFSSALQMWISGAHQRIGYRSDFRGFFLRPALTKPLKGEIHYVTEILNLLEPLGLRPKDRPSIRFPWSMDELEEFDQRLHTLGLQKRHYIVVAPFAAYGPAKEWPLPRFVELAAHLGNNTGFPVVFVGAAHERPRLPNAPGLNLMGQTPLRFLAYLLYHAALVIGNDSGVPHLADTLGAPTLMFFGPTPPSWTAPLHGRALSHPVSCAPCGRRTCPYGHHRCMKEIAVPQALKEALKLLSLPQP